MSLDADIDSVLSVAKDQSRKSYRRDSKERRRESRSRSRSRERSRNYEKRTRRRSRDDRETRRASSREKSSKGGSYSNRHVNRDYPFERLLRQSPERETAWDCPPIGYEHMTTAEFKELRASGALPLMQPNEVGGGNVFQRLCVSNLTDDCTEETLQTFFNENMIKAKLIIHPGDCCVAVQLNSNKTYALVHFRSQEETNNAMVFDGAVFNGKPLTVRRAKDYVPPRVQVGTQQDQHLHDRIPVKYASTFKYNYFLGAMTGMLADSLNKLFIACLPTYLDDDQVKELLQAFGELKAFNLVKDGITGISKGYAFCEYIDPAVTDLSIAGLHQMQVGDKRLVVQRAVLGAKNSLHYNAFMMSQLQVPGIDTTKIGATQEAEASQVVCLMNMVTVDDLVNDEEYEEIYDDIKTECSKYGNIVSMVIPRPAADREVPGLEKVFIEYDSIESARSAYGALAGRKFSGRIVITSFFDKMRYFNKEY